MKVHTKYKCSLRNRSFSNADSLSEHESSLHNNGRPFDCRYCGKLFKSSRALNYHVRIHTDSKPYSCTHCSDRLTWHVQLKTHLLKSHNEGTWLNCYICEKKFSQSVNLKMHLLRHGGVKPYFCSECPKCFYTAAELKCHRLVHSDFKQFCCCRCGKSFKRRGTVVSHFKSCCRKTGLRHRLMSLLYPPK